MHTPYLDGIKTAGLRAFMRSGGAKKMLASPQFLISGGGGALAGGAAGAYLDEENKLRGGLIGAGSGLLIGAGVGSGLWARKMKNIKLEADAKAQKKWWGKVKSFFKG